MMEVNMKMHQVALFLKKLLKECLLKNEHFNIYFLKINLDL